MLAGACRWGACGALPRKGRRCRAINLRLSGPGPIACLPMDHSDVLETFDDLPRDGRCVGHVWS